MYPWRDPPVSHYEAHPKDNKYSGPAGVVPDLPVPVLIGRDFPLLSQLWLHLAMGGQRKPRGTPSPPLPRQRRSEPRLCGFQDVDPQASTDPLSEEESNAAAAVAEEDIGPVTTREDEGTPSAKRETPHQAGRKPTNGTCSP